MKKTYFSILILSLLLACLTACGAQAKQPDEPAPAQQVDQTEPTQPEQPAEPAPEQIASQVSVQQDMTFDQLKPYFQKSFEMSEYLDGDMESHIQIELDTIEYLVDVDGAGTLPGNYADMYRNWRPLRLSEHFTDCNETVYATSQVNLRKGPSTDYEKVGSLKGGDSITRTGIGTGDFENWSRVILADGTEVYVNNGYCFILIEIKLSKEKWEW